MLLLRVVPPRLPPGGGGVRLRVLGGDGGLPRAVLHALPPPGDCGSQGAQGASGQRAGVHPPGQRVHPLGHRVHSLAVYLRVKN